MNNQLEEAITNPKSLNYLRIEKAINSCKDVFQLDTCAKWVETLTKNDTLTESEYHRLNKKIQVIMRLQ